MEKSLKSTNNNRVFSLESINFHGFSTSKYWIGYFERRDSYSVSLVKEAVGILQGFLTPYSNSYFMVVTAIFDALEAWGRRVEDDPEILEFYDRSYNKFKKLGVFSSMDREFEDYCDEKTNVPSNSLRFLYTKDDFYELSELMMSHSDIRRSACFCIIPELNLIFYPHDDTGFGCIAINEDISNGLIFLKHIREHHKNFKVYIDSEQ